MMKPSDRVYNEALTEVKRTKRQNKRILYKFKKISGLYSDLNLQNINYKLLALSDAFYKLRAKESSRDSEI
jgi:hypothetical protein